MRINGRTIVEKAVKAQISQMEKILLENEINDIEIDAVIRSKSDIEFLLRGPEDSLAKAKKILSL